METEKYSLMHQNTQLRCDPGTNCALHLKEMRLWLVCGSVAAAVTDDRVFATASLRSGTRARLLNAFSVPIPTTRPPGVHRWRDQPRAMGCNAVGVLGVEPRCGRDVGRHAIR